MDAQDHFHLTLSVDYARLLRKWAYNVSRDPEVPAKEKRVAEDLVKYLDNKLPVEAGDVAKQ